MKNAQSSSANTKAHSMLKVKDLWGIYWLHKADHSMQRIANIVGITKATVQSVITRIRKTGTPIAQQRPGRPKKANERDLQRLKHIVHGHPFAAYSRINAMFNLNGIDISRTTLIRYLKSLGFGSYYAARKPKLTEEKKKKRLGWAKERCSVTFN